MAVRTPAFRKLTMAGACGSPSQDVDVFGPPPRLILTDATVMPPGRFRFANTWLSAATWSDVKAAMQGAGLGAHWPATLKRVNTWMAKIAPFLATPLDGSPALGLVFKPAAMPATCVPWSHRLAAPLRHCPIGCPAPAPV